MPTQSVTKSSHYVSVQQSSTTGGGTSTRYLSWTVGGRSHYFCSLPGILRILEIILLLVVLIIARAGKDGHQQPFGRVDASFLGIGSTVGLLIIFLMFTLCTLLGHIIPNLLEVLATLVGAILMITTGALAITYYHNLYPRDNVRMIFENFLTIIFFMNISRLEWPLDRWRLSLELFWQLILLSVFENWESLSTKFNWSCFVIIIIY